MVSSVQSLDRLGHWGDMMNDSAEILFQAFLQEAIVSSSGMGRDVHFWHCPSSISCANHSDLAPRKGRQGRLFLCFKNIYKWDMKVLDIDVNRWEKLASDWSLWRLEIGSTLTRDEAKWPQVAGERKVQWKNSQATMRTLPDSAYRCSLCNRDCHYWVGLYSHNWCCSTDWYLYQRYIFMVSGDQSRPTSSNSFPIFIIEIFISFTLIPDSPLLQQDRHPKLHQEWLFQCLLTQNLKETRKKMRAESMHLDLIYTTTHAAC